MVLHIAGYGARLSELEVSSTRVRHNLASHGLLTPVLTFEVCLLSSLAAK